ncbi:MAG: hypothetical protein R2836_01255 [Chitinophagales bacterium]
MFDNINGMENVSQEKKYFSGLKNEKNLSFIKTNLFDIIVNGLVAYSNDIEIELMKLLQQTQILLDKGLKEDALKKILKYIQLCERYDLRNYLPIAYVKKYKSSNSFNVYNIENEQEILKEMKINQAWLEQRILIDGLQADIIHKRLKMGLSPRTENEIREINEILENDVLAENSKHTISLNVIKEYVKIMCYGMLGKREDSLKSHEKMYNLINANNDFKERDKAFYFDLVMNYLQILAVRVQDKDFFKVYNKVKIELKNEKSAKVLVKKDYYILRLEFCVVLINLALDKLPEAGKKAKEIVQMYPWAVTASSFKSYIYENTAKALFLTKDYECTLDLINLFIEDDEIRKQPQRLITGKLFQLILHYELGNIELANNLCVNLYREMLRKEVLFEEHSLLMKYFKKIVSSPKNEEAEVFKELYENISDWKSKVKNADLVSFFDLLYWVKLKARV